MKFTGFGAIAAASSAILVACGGPADSGRPSEGVDVGSARIAVTQAPSDVQCISVTAVGSSAKTANFDVKPGQSTVLTMTGIPTGTVSFSGQAFNAACGAIMGVTPGWIANPVTTTVSGSTPAIVTLAMVRNTSAQVNVDFPDGSTCGGAAAPCDPAAMPTTCCAGLACTKDPTSPVGGSCQASCGSAGTACVDSTSCCSGLSCVTDPTMGKGLCQSTMPTCGGAGTACVDSTSCCSGLSCVTDPMTGKGLCQSTMPACGGAGTACVDPTSCCSGLSCVIDPTTGKGLCQ